MEAASGCRVLDELLYVQRTQTTAPFVCPALRLQPTIVAVCCGQYIDQWHLYAGGIFDTNAHCTAPLDHAVLVVGYGAEADGTPYWLM